MPVILLISFLFCLFGSLYKAAAIFALLILIPAAYHLRNLMKEYKFIKQIKNMPSEERKIYEDIFSAADKKLQEEQIKHTPQGPRYYGGYRSYYN